MADRGALDGLRVLDRTDRRGALCGRLLAGLGADVVHLVPPSTGATESRPPDFEWYYRSGLRRLELDPADPGARERLLELARQADVWLEAPGEPVLGLPRGDASRPGSPGGAGADWPVSWEELRAANPQLVVVVLTPFGLAGPRAGWLGGELVCAAAGGMVLVNGHPRSPPLAPFGRQADHGAGLWGAIAALLALRTRARTGRGQALDVSVAAAATAMLEHATGKYRQEGRVGPRSGTLHWTRHFRVGPCLDGEVLHCTLGDWETLSLWAVDEGADPLLLDPELLDAAVRQRRAEDVFSALDGWSAARTTEQVIEGARLRRLPYAAVGRPEDLARHPQLLARGMAPPPVQGGLPRPPPPVAMSATAWVAAGEPRVAGAATSLSAGPFAWPARSRGAHRGAVPSGREVPGDTPDAAGEPSPRGPAGASVRGPSPGETPGAVAPDPSREGGLKVATPRAPGGGLPAQASGGLPAQASGGEARPLDGLRVLDFTWVVAGPVATRILADHGADVVKLERREATDFGDRRGGLSGNLNRGKRGLVLDFSKPEGRELVRSLALRSDVVIDNFSPRVMEQLGLDHANLARERPSVITVRMSGFGLTGPWRDGVSYGPTLQAIAGLPRLMRHAGGPLAGWGYSFADMAAGTMAALATLAALRHRDRTGEGQLVDLGQFGVLVSLLGPDLAALLSGRAVAPPGNRSQEGPAAPHGVYRCAATGAGPGDDDRWIAIAVASDVQWDALAGVLAAAGEAWASAPALRRLEERLARADEIDRRLESWSRREPGGALAERLQRAGVPAAVVASAADLCAPDPQLAARGYFARVPTPEGREVELDGIPFLAGEQAGRVAGPGPLLGEHTDRVLREWLGAAEADLARWRTTGVIA